MKFSGKKINDFMKSLREKINSNKDAIIREATTTVANGQKRNTRSLKPEAFITAAALAVAGVTGVVGNETDYYNHKDLIADGVFFQTILDQNINGLDIDINIAPKGTFEAMSKDKECDKNILEIIEEHKEKNQDEDLEH